MAHFEFDAAVVGSGHNGLAAAIVMAQEGRKVVVYEARDSVGGGARTEEWTIPGFRHDVCSAIHPMAVGSFFLSGLPLKKFGLEWVHSEIPLAHPMPAQETAYLYGSVEKTAQGVESPKYARVVGPLVSQWRELFRDAMGPIGVPRHPVLMSCFGKWGMRSAQSFGEAVFQTEQGRALFAGLAAHSFLPMEQVPSAAIGLMLAIAGHGPGWPFPKGGAQAISDAMAGYFESLGGVIRTGVMVDQLADVETAGPVFFETAPKHLARICGSELPAGFCRRLMAYQHGPGVFKMDWALDGPIPWADPGVARAATVHLGTLEEIAASERASWRSARVERPYVLLAQPSLFDDTRAPKGKHTAWAYCHVPNGSDWDYEAAMEEQIERSAPGFRDLILGKHVMNCSSYEAYNPNFVGGDTVGGANTLSQLFTRPTVRLNPYTTPNPRIFLCSASTPPGGGIHGLAGFYAAQNALRRWPF